MRSYFPKALLFKELRMGRWYLLLGILAFSLSPFIDFTLTRGLSPEIASISNNTSVPIIEWQTIGQSLPVGIGFLPLVFSAGLAVASLYELLNSTSIQLASEPLRLKSILVTKFITGLGTIFTSQTLTALWVGIALNFKQSFGPFAFFYGWWLVGSVVGITFFAVTFLLVLIVRPVLFGILLMLTVLVAPLYVSHLFIGIWHHPLGNGRFDDTTPTWGYHAYNTIYDFSPYGILHYGPDTMIHFPGYFTLHAIEPLLWVILSFMTVLWFAQNRTCLLADFRSRKYPVLSWPIGGIIRGASTLFAALIVENYVLHLHTEQLWSKILTTLFLWLCCHLLAKAFIGNWSLKEAGDMRKRLLNHTKGE